jgi:hypothetical protein
VHWSLVIALRVEATGLCAGRLGTVQNDRSTPAP